MDVSSQVDRENSCFFHLFYSIQVHNRSDDPSTLVRAIFTYSALPETLLQTYPGKKNALPVS
jgi:hypothetical protein